MFLRSALNYDRDAVSRETGLEFTDDDYENCIVDESKAVDADINEIVRRFGVTGTLPVVDLAPLQGAFDDVFDFQTAMNAVRQAEEGFMALPAEVRAKFRNSPGELLSFLEDPKNRDEAVKLGLVKAPPAANPGSADPKPAGDPPKP